MPLFAIEAQPSVMSLNAAGDPKVSLSLRVLKVSCHLQSCQVSNVGALENACGGSGVVLFLVSPAPFRFNLGTTDAPFVSVLCALS
jgi:hypothetical protein